MESFLYKHNFFIDEKRTQWNLNIKVKAFHDSISCFMKCPWNCILWNALKEKFRSVSLPLGTQRQLQTFMSSLLTSRQKVIV